MENCGSETFCAPPPSQDRVKLLCPPFRECKRFVPPSLNLNLPYPVLMIDKGSRAVIHIIGSGDGTMSTTYQDPKLVVRLSIGVCGRKLHFAAVLKNVGANYKQQASKSCVLVPKIHQGVIISLTEVPKILGAAETPFLLQAPMHFKVPSSGLDMPCAVPNFMAVYPP